LISEKSKQLIIDTAQVEDIVGDFVTLTRKGANLSGLCPFHNEKTPSFNVNPTRNIYKCFGCGEGGDPIKFLMEYEQMSFPEALRYIAKKYGIEIEETETSQEAIQERQLVDSLHIITEYAKDYYQKQMFETDAGKSVGLSYFKSRGFREETIKKWGLGITPAKKDGFTKQATDDGYNIELLRKLGLTNKYDSDFFRERVMFTIRSLSGKVIAYAGRTLSKDKKIPKYINSPETEIYVKNKVLFGIHFARKTIRDEDECIIVEGYTDVISLHQSGIENVVASSGTSLTVGQINLIKRYTPNIKILYDGDAAGIKAALRGLDLVLEQDMNVKVVLLPDGEDPDSYMQKVGRAEFKKYADEQAKDFILFKTDLLLKEVGNDPVKRAGLVKDIVGSIARIPDAIKRSLYTKECSKVMDLDEAILITEVNKAVIEQAKIRQKEAEREKRRRQNQSRPNSGGSYQQGGSLPAHYPPMPGEADMSGPPPDIGWPGEESFSGEGQGQEMPPEQIEDVTERRTRGDAFQEKDIARIIVTLGDKVFDKETNTTVAQYILTEIQEVLEHFDHPLYEKIARTTLEMLVKKKPITDKTFTAHEDAEIQEFTINCFSPVYGELSPGWEERGVILNTQKMPELNFTRDSLEGLQRFKLKKVIRMCNQNQERMKALEKDDIDQLMTLMRVQMKLNEMRDALAKETNTVVFK
jgi:DNA primase